MVLRKGGVILLEQDGDDDDNDYANDDDDTDDDCDGGDYDDRGYEDGNYGIRGGVLAAYTCAPRQTRALQYDTSSAVSVFGNRIFSAPVKHAA